MALPLLLLFLLAGLLASCGCGPAGPEEAAAPGRPGGAAGDGRWPILQRGVVVALRKVSVDATRSTQVRSLLPDGALVQAGQVVCQLVMADREDELAKKRADRESKEIQWRRVRDGQGFEREVAAVKRELAEVELARTAEELGKATDQREWQQILEEETAQRVRRQEIGLVRRKLDALRDLERRGFGSPQERLAAEELLGRLTLEASQAARLVPWLEKTPDRQAVLTATLAWEGASLALDLARLVERGQAGIQEVKLVAARAELDDAASAVARLEAEIASGTLVASIAGMVVRENTWVGSGWEKVSEGDRVFTGRPILNILDLGTLGVEFPLEQRFAGLVAGGCPVTFRPDAFPGRLWTGVVATVPAVVLETQFRDPEGERALTVQVAFREATPTLPLGFTGTVEIFPPGTDLAAATAARPGSRRTSLAAGPRRRDLTLPGEVKARQRGLVAAPFAARLSYLQEDGVSVKKGEVVARLDTAEIEKGLGEQRIQVQNKTEQLELQRQKNRVDLSRWEGLVATRRSALRVAELEHEMLLTRRDEAEILNLQKNRDLIAARRTLNEEETKHVGELRARGLKSELELDESRLAGARLEREREINAHKLDLEVSGPTRRQVRLSELARHQAALELRQAEREAAQASFTARLDEETLVAEIRKLTLEVAEKEQRLRESAIPAPQDGVVILPEVWKEGEMGKMKLGDQVSRQIPFMHIADLDQLEINVEVPETEVGFLAPGRPVRITAKSAPGRVFPGWIADVGTVAENDLLERQNALVDVFLALTNPASGVTKVDEAFRPGASCEIAMPLYDLPAAVAVPFAAVWPTPDGPAVFDGDGRPAALPLAFADGLAGYVLADPAWAGREILLPEAVR
ncbi:MAG: HlyD family efflux transporter periplasmic adaptor subunit [Candidatus Riflebacteria bacterium]|nr:HlyD family efflux transporter periplasmic adaptor subunit [Candidatus Riflebacteria bacterium]